MHIYIYKFVLVWTSDFNFSCVHTCKLLGCEKHIQPVCAYLEALAPELTDPCIELGAMATHDQPKLATVKGDGEEKDDGAKALKVAEAESRGDNLTVAMLVVPFFVDKVGFYLGDQCVQLACLSQTIEATGHD